jgi:hypothetical protein
MTQRSTNLYRKHVVVLTLACSIAVTAVRWASEVRPRAEALRVGREALHAERLRLGETRARLLQFGSEGIADRTRALRTEVERREALAPAGSLEQAGAEVRERFAALAARYGVHAPTFEQIPVTTAGEVQVGGLRIRAAGGYHALGTWITESISHDRLLDLREAKLRAVPDTLMRRIRQSSSGHAVLPTNQPSGAPATPGGLLELSGANPLDAVIEFVVQWYALPVPHPIPSAPEVR